MPRTRTFTICCALLVAAVLIPAAAGLTEQAPTVTVLTVVTTGGGPPGASKIGEISVVRGDVRDAAENIIGSWRWRCKYIGGAGKGKQTSHFCTETFGINDQGSILIEGGFGYASAAARWVAVTGGTGTYRGVFGVAQYKNLTSASTPFTFYLMRK